MHKSYKIVLVLLLAVLAFRCSPSSSSGSGSGAVTCPTTNQAYAIDGNNNLLCFGLTTPTTVVTTAVTGLAGGENIVGIDFRPADGKLYALSSVGQLYTLDTSSGAVTAVGTPLTFAGATTFGFDVNPFVDRIRVMTNNGINVRINPTTGALTTDTTLSYAVADAHNGATPDVEATAYSNNVAGVSSTVLYAIDSTLDILTISNPPNNGTLNTVGALGVNTDVNTSFDIKTTAGTDYGYAVLTPAASTVSSLYTINLTTGAATLVHSITSGSAIHAFAVAL